MKSQGAGGKIPCHHHCSSLVAAAVQWELAFVCIAGLPRAPVGASVARAGPCVCAYLRVSCSESAAEWEGVSSTSGLPCPLAAFSQHGGSASRAQPKNRGGLVHVCHSPSQQGSFPSAALLLQDTSLAPERERGLQNSEVLLAGVCFLEGNLQSAIARPVCGPPKPGAACALPVLLHPAL